MYLVKEVKLDPWVLKETLDPSENQDQQGCQVILVPQERGVSLGQEVHLGLWVHRVKEDRRANKDLLVHLVCLV